MHFKTIFIFFLKQKEVTASRCCQTGFNGSVYRDRYYIVSYPIRCCIFYFVFLLSVITHISVKIRQLLSEMHSFINCHIFHYVVDQLINCAGTLCNFTVFVRISLQSWVNCVRRSPKNILICNPNDFP